jgi:hypothetical protein
MTTPFAAIDDMLTAATLGALADITVTPDGGEPFPAILDLNRTELFEVARTCDWTIRYAAAKATLGARQTVHINGSPRIAPDAVLQLIADPTPLAGGRECRAELIMRA